jgi:putative addiction module component (TIGR02574 family)
MSNVTTVLESTEQWSLNEQLELAVRLRDRLVSQGWIPETSAADLVEIERRLTDAEANPENVISWDEIVHHVRRKS